MIGTRNEETLDLINSRNFLRNFDLFNNYRRNISRNLMMFFLFQAMVKEIGVFLIISKVFKENFDSPYICYHLTSLVFLLNTWRTPTNMCDWAYRNLV